MGISDVMSGGNKQNKKEKEILFPPSLESGDKIAILSPSSPVKEEYIDGAYAFLQAQGFTPVVMTYAKGPSSGSYASEAENRLRDFFKAWDDPTIKAVLCSRGGYGAVHLLRHIDPLRLRHSPKWLIGYSDISALHAALLRAGVASIHGPMAKHLTEEGADEATNYLLRILRGDFPVAYHIEANPKNRFGEAKGILAGGNLAVLHGLAGTCFDIISEETVLFIEDISEAIYAVERMLYRILLSGGFEKIKGLIVGRFTEYRADKNYETMEEMISGFIVREGLTHLPVAFNFPVGHVKENYPLIEGAEVTLTVNEKGTELIMKK